jgi:hypothetical protein
MHVSLTIYYLEIFNIFISFMQILQFNFVHIEQVEVC